MNKTKDPATWNRRGLLQEVYRLGGLYENEQCDSEFWKGRAAAFEVKAGKLRAFAQDIMRAWPEGDVDGGELQEAAARHGLLRETHPTEPCGEGCTCVEYYPDEDFADGSATCYRKTELLSPNVGGKP